MYIPRRVSIIINNRRLLQTWPNSGPVLGNGLVLSVLDSQSLGTGFDAPMEVCLSILFLPHLCQQSNYYHIRKV